MKYNLRDTSQLIKVYDDDVKLLRDIYLRAKILKYSGKIKNNIQHLKY